ncbi:MAG: Ldh family oxidoreductase [Calditrichia bacterium]
MEHRIIQKTALFNFVVEITKNIGVSEKDARCVADNLVLADLRGVDSHGVARLKRYVEGIQSGYIIADAQPEIIRQNSVMAHVDGHNGLGQVAGVFGMELAIEKAEKEGLGLVTVKNSNHYGIAGYYALMALEKNLIGISLTNSAPLVVPTFGKNALLGTNPISMAVPTDKERPWVVDMATSVVPRGKLEVYNRLNKPLPEGWATDETGRVTSDAGRVLKNLLGRLGGGILPLGGAGELYGGHKGYGLNMLVDILCGVLPGSNYGADVVSKKEGKVCHPRVGHFFMALDPTFFMDEAEFKSKMDGYIQTLHNSEKAEGAERIWVHGEKEFLAEEERLKNGIPLDLPTVENLQELGEKYGVPIEFE